MTQDAPHLDFVSYGVDQLGSLASALAEAEAPGRCGVYVLRFRAGEAYVGKTRNIVARFSTHARRFGDIERLEFAVCAVNRLDDAERHVIAAVGASTPLRNIALTDRPGGWGDLTIEVRDGEHAVLPYERDERPAVDAVVTGTHLDRLWRLRTRSDYTDLRECVGAYIDRVIPDPIMTVGNLWTISALPATRRSKHDYRLLTLNCGAMETLWVREVTDDFDVTETVIVLNVSANALHDSDRERVSDLAHVEQAGYKSVSTLHLLVCGWEDFSRLLADDAVLNAAYALNVTLMRRGSRQLSKSHNSALGFDVLDAARAQRASAAGPAR